MKRLLILALLSPVALCAQVPADTAATGVPVATAPGAERGLTFGVTGFTGGLWQPSGIDIGVVQAVGSRRGTSIGALLRLGSFVQDQAVIIGRTQGFFIAGAASLRLPLVDLLAVGSEDRPSHIRLISVVETGGSLNLDSPLPQGRAHGFVAPLLGFVLSGGSGRIDEGFGILFGPAIFLGSTTTWHGQFSMRYQAPLRRRAARDGGEARR